MNLRAGTAASSTTRTRAGVRHHHHCIQEKQHLGVWLRDCDMSEKVVLGSPYNTTHQSDDTYKPDRLAECDFLLWVYPQSKGWEKQEKEDQVWLHVFKGEWEISNEMHNSKFNEHDKHLTVYTADVRINFNLDTISPPASNLWEVLGPTTIYLALPSTLVQHKRLYPRRSRSSQRMLCAWSCSKSTLTPSCSASDLLAALEPTSREW